ncbi:MAG TPA: tripartite tricarboxylate transporter substrate binding protein [Acetobacteraceae bacterium]|nr:tripartite tricarboxylate transporter substrate binding protein [Acetobacteraceae bacterium]
MLGATTLLAPPTLAQGGGEWSPTRPIRILVGFPPGQATDTIARLLAERMQETLGWQTVIENRPGQGGSLAAAAAAQAAPDGHTWLLSATAPLATNPNLYRNIGYDPARDFSAITLVANLPFILAVAPQVPARTVPELIALIRENPGRITFGTPGNGTTAHLITAMFARAAGGLDLVHVPYRGSAQILPDMLAGRVQFMFDTAVFIAPHMQAGRLRGLAVTALNRTALMPDLPALSEFGLAGFDAAAWLGMVAPAGTPRPAIERIAAELHRIVRTPAVAERLAGMGAEVLTNTPEEFQAHIVAELAKWGRAVRENNVQLD